MIKLKKTAQSPIVLDRRRNCKLTQETNTNNLRYTENAVDYDSGAVIMAFDSSIYGHSNVKSELIKNQHGKCAFCEQHILSVSYGDVEHFRPKGGYKQNEKDTLHKPGYYWLAYDWFNLLLCCQKCNQRYKKNLFPIINKDCRAKNHTNSTKHEKSIFVNPYHENPKFLIGFRKEIAFGKDKKARGKKTIEALNLNRKGNGFSDLYELRKDRFQLVEQTSLIASMKPNANITQAQIDKAKNLMVSYKKRNNLFSAMINDNF